MFRTLVIVCLVLTASQAHAARIRPWASASASWSTYSMSDVNRQIGAINAALIGSGLSMDEINNGFGFGFAAGIEMENGVALGLGYDRLTGSSEVGDFSGSLKYDLPANVFRFAADYTFPGRGRALVHVGAGAGIVSEAGSLSLTVTGVGSVKGALSGTGPMAEGHAGVDVWTAPGFAITIDAGYRYAKVGEVKTQGQTIYNADGSKYTIDYSGVALRLGLEVRGGGGS